MKSSGARADSITSTERLAVDTRWKNGSRPNTNWTKRTSAQRIRITFTDCGYRNLLHPLRKFGTAVAFWEKVKACEPGVGHPLRNPISRFGPDILAAGRGRIRGPGTGG